MTRAPRRFALAAFALVLLAPPAARPVPLAAAPATFEAGIDRSNMSTEWTLSPPAEPNVPPFNGPYNGAGIFEARRIAVFDGIARMKPAWFRDGFGADTAADAQLFADTVAQVHARGIKMLAIVGVTGLDFNPRDLIKGDPSVNGCRWSTQRLSAIDLTKFEHRLRTHFDALKAAGLSVDAFEIGNELDLYCNDADMPPTAEFAAHHWTWFLNDAQVHAFAAGYIPVLVTAVRTIKAYFPQAKIITFGMGNPTGNSAPLIAALAHFTDASGVATDYTRLVDGYGTHIYPPGDTTQHLVERATAEFTQQMATLPHADRKPLWVTEWSEAAAAAWASRTWYFQYDANGRVGGDLNRAGGAYPAMTRAQAIRTFERDVVDKLREAPEPVNVAVLMYYSYDSFAKSSMCDATAFNRKRSIQGVCYNGVIDPVDGSLLPDVAAALTAQRQ